VRLVSPILLVALVALTGCDGAPGLQRTTGVVVPTTPVVRLSPDAIVVQGVIDDAAVKQFRKIVDSGVEKVHLRSPGGTVAAAIEIAREIRKRNIDVVVDGRCASACANYLFVAGRRKSVVGDGILLMHGGASFRAANVVQQFPLTTSRQVAIRALHMLSLRPLADDPALSGAYERIRTSLDSKVRQSILEEQLMEQAFYAELGVLPTLLDFSNVVGKCSAAEAVEIRIGLPVHSEVPSLSDPTIDIKTTYSIRQEFWFSPIREDWESVGLADIQAFRQPSNITAAIHFAKSGGKEKVILGPVSRLRESDCSE
jgi:hypothetical protein